MVFKNIRLKLLYKVKKVLSISPSSFQHFNCCQMIQSKDDLKKRLLEKSLIIKKQLSNNKKKYIFISLPDVFKESNKNFEIC